MKCAFSHTRVRFGHKVSNSNRRTKRTFKPNIQQFKLFSPTLNTFFKVKLATRVNKTIDKVGGLDSFVSKYEYPDSQVYNKIKSSILKHQKKQLNKNEKSRISQEPKK